MMGRGLIGCFIDALCDCALCFFFQYGNVLLFLEEFLCVFLAVLRVEKVSVLAMQLI